MFSKLSLILLSFLTFLEVRATDLLFSIESIPSVLLTNANAVVRKDSSVFQIESPEKATLFVNKIVSVLNIKGKENARLKLAYDDFSRVDFINAVIYDQYGQEVKRFRKSDIQDVSNYSGYSLFESTRLKILNSDYFLYPFTIEFSYRISYSGLLSYPSWCPLNSKSVSVESAAFVVLKPPSIYYSYLELEKRISKTKIDLPQLDGVKWCLSNIGVDTNFLFNELEFEKTESLLLAPRIFKMQDFQGDLTSWKTFGQWINSLNEDRSDLDKKYQLHILEYIGSLTDTLSVIRSLYEYLQNNTRYVSVQVGLGGWQPLKSSIVAKLGYGDCKALTMFMKSLLEIVNIKSYYSLVYAGEQTSDIHKEFPSNQFNHAVLCVPFLNDTIWLECTSQTNPFNYIGGFINNRSALVITESGGVIAKIGVNKFQENLLFNKIMLELDSNLVSSVFINSLSKGIFYDYSKPIASLTNIDQKRYYSESYGGMNFQIKSITVNNNDTVFSLSEEIKMLFYDRCKVLKKSILFAINLNSKKIDYKNFCKPTENGFELKGDIEILDSLFCFLPQGYVVSGNPVMDSIMCQYGNFYVTSFYEGNRVVFCRRYSLKQTKYSAYDYSSFVEFWSNTFEKSNLQCTLVRDSNH